MSVSSLVWKTAKRGAIALVGGPVLVVLLLVATGPLLSNAPIHIQQNQPVRHFENNYRPGTEAYVLTQLAHEAFPYLDILISDQRFQDQMTAASKVAHPLESMNLVHRIGLHQLSDSSITGRRTKVLGSMAWKEELLSLNVCLLYMTSDGLNRSRTEAMLTVFHESIHCSRAKLQQQDRSKLSRDRRRLLERMPTLAKQRRDPEMMSRLFFVSEEAFVTAAERSQSFMPGAVGMIARAAYQSELESAKRNSLGNESPHVALLIEKLCAKAGDCPTDTPSLSAFLLSRDEYVAALEKDILRWADIRR